MRAISLPLLRIPPLHISPLKNPLRYAKGMIPLLASGRLSCPARFPGEAARLRQISVRFLGYADPQHSAIQESQPHRLDRWPIRPGQPHQPDGVRAAGGIRTVWPSSASGTTALAPSACGTPSTTPRGRTSTSGSRRARGVGEAWQAEFRAWSSPCFRTARAGGSAASSSGSVRSRRRSEARAASRRDTDWHCGSGPLL